MPVGRHAIAALADWLGPGGRPALVPDRWARRGDADAVFLNRRGGRLSRQGAWLVVTRWGGEVGLDGKLTPHVLRHSCATHMLDHGADIRAVQEMLGHASVSTTQVYTKVSTERLFAAYRDAHPRATLGRAGLTRPSDLTGRVATDAQRQLRSGPVPFVRDRPDDAVHAARPARRGACSARRADLVARGRSRRIAGLRRQLRRLRPGRRRAGREPGVAQPAQRAARRGRPRPGRRSTPARTGCCEVCGKPIAEARLEAMPATRFCIDHA